MRQLKSENKESENYINLFCTFRNRLCEYLKDIMKINDDITGFCNHPAAVIRLETDNEEPVFTRQYPLPFVHRKIATEQVIKWFQIGTTEKETALNHSNHPVMVVPKRDISGSIKDWRTCIDPRKMNVKIRSSTFPLPTIREIFESLAGKISLRSFVYPASVPSAIVSASSFTTPSILNFYRLFLRLSGSLSHNCRNRGALQK